MDENENKSNVEETTQNATSSAKEKVTTVLKKVVELVKTHKKVLIGVVVVVLAIVLVGNVFLGGKKKVVKNFIKSMNGTNLDKVYKNINLAGANVFAELDEDDYEDFYEEYKDYVDSDEWEDSEEEFNEYLDENKEDVEDDMDDDEGKYKVEEFKDVKKVGKNLYEVKAKVEYTDEDGDDSSQTIKFYVMKKGLKYYLVGDDSYLIRSLTYSL